MAELATIEPELLTALNGRKWFHTIDLGNGLVTPGQPPSEVLSSHGAIPDVSNKSVLDIGTWDGKYAFEAERAGAARVVALDSFIWQLDPAKLNAYYEQCEQANRLPDPDVVTGGALKADGWSPGKGGFDIVKKHLNSQVEDITDDFMTMDLSTLGCFDVVFFFGVLYHMLNPMLALQRLGRVTGHVAVIETLSLVAPGYELGNLLEFYPGKEAADDYTNWFAPSEPCLHGMCRAAGFSRVQTVARGPIAERSPSEVAGRARRHKSPQQLLHRRIVVHAFA